MWIALSGRIPPFTHAIWREKLRVLGHTVVPVPDAEEELSHTVHVVQATRPEVVWNASVCIHAPAWLVKLVGAAERSSTPRSTSSRTETVHIHLTPSDDGRSKWVAHLPSGKRVRFGQAGAEDYTIHQDFDRMVQYVRRHMRAKDEDMPSRPTHKSLLRLRSPAEDWSPTGYTTAGWLSRYILWSAPSLEEVQSLLRQAFNIHITWDG